MLYRNRAEEMSSSMLIQRVQEAISDELAKEIIILDLKQTTEATNAVCSAAA